MAITDDLQNHLDQAEPDELVEVFLVLKTSAVMSESLPVDPLDIKEGRKKFAINANRMINSAIEKASEKCGKSLEHVTIYDHVASARLCAPVKLIEYLGEHPTVAFISLAPDE